MAEALTRIVREVERVVTAPYVPSLQDLYELVQQSSSAAISSWALQKPCQVGLLADALVEGLSRSRVALPLLAAFASTTRFRDALLCRHPAILDAFLEKAVDVGDNEYNPACIALLSSPLPPGVVPPARLASFITQLVSIMAARPCAETVAPLHTLMSSLSSSSRILDEVPTEVMSNLQLEFTKTLRNLDDHMGNLLCLAAFARIASTRDTRTHNQHGPEPPSWLLNIQHFFGPKRGLKTLDLVVLRVILACSANCNNLTPSQAAESIRLAICIADAVDPSQKESWIAANSSKIAKLCEKVSRDGLDREIQVIGIAFLLSLRPVVALPPQIRDLGLRILASKDSQNALSIMPPHVVSRLTTSLATCDESIVYELLRFTVDALKDDIQSRGSLSSLDVADLLLSALQSAESRSVVSSLLGSDSTKETIASLLGRFPIAQKEANCQGAEVCDCAYSSMKNRVFLRLFEIYFAATLSQNGNDTDILVMKTLVGRVTTNFTQVCCFSTSNTKDFRGSLYVRDRRDVASTQHPARDWRSGVAETFRQNAQASHDNMMKILGDICFDLERRCYDVEGPLRSVEAERDRHAFEAEQLRRRNEELESQLKDSSSKVSALQQELTRLEEQAEVAYARVEELSISLDSAQREAKEQRRASEETLHTERQAARTRELDLIATSTGKDDQLEELQEELHSLRSENEHMRLRLDEASKEMATSSETSVCLQRELEDVKARLETAKAMCSQKEDEVKRLLTDKEDLSMELGTAKQMTEEQNLEIERIYSALQEAEEKLQIEVEMLTHKHEAAATQAETEVAKHKEENARLRTAMQAAARDHNQELRSKEKRIQLLEKKIQSLRNERATKAREFSEAQEHISRLMGVMGFSAKPAEPPVSTRPNRAGSTSRRHSKTYDEDEDTQLAESFDDLTCNMQGPSPKHPRGNCRSVDMSQVPPPKTPGPVAPRANIPPTTASRAGIIRQPLAETDSNSPVTSQATNMGKDSQHDAASPDKPGDRLQNFDLDMDLEFSKDFIFTSTAFSGSNEQPAPQ